MSAKQHIKQPQKNKFMLKPIFHMFFIFFITFVSTLLILSMLLPSGKKIVNYTLNHLSLYFHLSLQNLEISGNTQLSDEKIISLLGYYKNMPMTTVDLQESNQKLMSVEWIKSSHITRIFPTSILIQISEYQPMFLWVFHPNVGYSDNVYIVSKTGHLITLLTPFNSRKFGDLPKIYANKNILLSVPRLQKVLQKYQLWKYVTSMTYIANRRWNIVLNGTLTVFLPAQKTSLAIWKISYLQKKYQLLAKKILILDLRNPSNIMAKLQKKHKKNRKNIL